MQENHISLWIDHGNIKYHHPKHRLPTRALSSPGCVGEGVSGPATGRLVLSESVECLCPGLTEEPQKATAA